MMKPIERIPRYQASDRLPDDVICMSYDVTQLEEEIIRLKKDAAPFQAQIDQRKTYVDNFEKRLDANEIRR